ncbi:myb-like protein D [Ctenocephalides felis]|uniref:myb-like protein D n=1 Tax=Ctenocephalides felis TaxID=7515 RepID=UPI000E6E4D41|nr:myb-like protein D [Ctenocephalides felis]XP_026479807.1 myb-like protein D [Ctenocephalides felis]
MSPKKSNINEGVIKKMVLGIKDDQAKETKNINENKLRNNNKEPQRNWNDMVIEEELSNSSNNIEVLKETNKKKNDMEIEEENSSNPDVIEAEKGNGRNDNHMVVEENSNKSQSELKLNIEKNYYSALDEGPYVVYAESMNQNLDFKKTFPRINEAVNYGTNMINKNRYEALSNLQEQEINIDQSRLMLMNKPRRIMERRQTENGRYIQMNNRNLKQTSGERNSQRREYCGKNIEIEEIRKIQIIHEELVKKLREKIRNKECDDLEEVVVKFKKDMDIIYEKYNSVEVRNISEQQNKVGFDNNNKS